MFDRLLRGGNRQGDSWLARPNAHLRGFRRAHSANHRYPEPEAAGWVFVVDRLNTHQSAALVKLVAQEEGECAIELELDKKGNLKEMKSMASRRAFLEDPTHQIRLVYTPKHTSWLNQIELWFSILVRRVLKRGSFTSVEDLSRRILEFIEYFNRTMAKPFKWTYKGVRWWSNRWLISTGMY